MADWFPVATFNDLQARKKRAVEVNGTTVALFNIKGKIYALADSCVHEHRPLSKGSVLFGKIICPGHQWKFDPETGIPDGQEGCQPTFPVRVEDDGTVAVLMEKVESAA